MLAQPTPVELLPYPDTRQLCDQRVYSHGGDIREIHWTLHASKDPLAQVAAFYRNQPGHTESPKGSDVSFDFGNGRIVAVFEKSRRREHPGCDTAPHALEKTLILTSVAR